MTNLQIYGKPLTLYNIAKYVLGYDKITEKHKNIWCDPLETNLKIYNRHLYLKPRGTYKSTIYNVSLVINFLLQDWVDNNGKFTKCILVASATNELAEQFVGEIKQHLRDNEKLTRIFGYCPIKRDNQQEIWLQPRVIKKEPNIKAKGALSSLTSEHYQIIICDDLANNDDRESETTRERKKRWLQDLISILDPGGMLILIGTRWHGSDLYQDIIDKNEKLSPEDRYHIEIEAAMDDEGEPLFPTILPKSRLQSLKIEKGLVEFYSQYMNNPLPAETQLFSIDKMHFYNEAESDLHIESNYAYMDPSLGSLAKSKGDYMFALIGARKNGCVYVRDCIATNTRTPYEVINELAVIAPKYHVIKTGIESNGYQTLFAQHAKNEDLQVVEINNVRKKETRIEGLEPLVSSGKVLFREDWRDVYPELIEQLIQYPVGRYDDGPDALEGLTRMVYRKEWNIKSLGNLVRGRKR